MPLVLTNTNPGRIEINDSSPQTIQKNKQYFLRVSTGKYTVRAFIQLYYQNPNEDIYICTSNLEYFLFKIRRIRNIKIKKIENEIKSREDEYIRLEEDIKIGVKHKKGGKHKMGAILKKGGKHKERLIRDTIKDQTYTSTINPLILSFSPNIFKSINSSLISPNLYLSEENDSSKIYKALKLNKLTYEELVEEVGEVENTLKSLLFTRVVLKVGERYELNPLLFM